MNILMIHPGTWPLHTDTLTLTSSHRLLNTGKNEAGTSHCNLCMSPSPFIYRFTLTKDEGEVVYGVNFARVQKISGVASVAEIQVRL